MTHLRIPRKIARRQAQQKVAYNNIKRSMTLTTSALALAGVAVTLIPTPKVAAASNGTVQLNATQQNFLNMVGPHAKKCAAENDLYASVMIAQAIIETGWGQSTLSKAPNYNLFGIKGNYNGQSVTLPTQEYVNGQFITIQDSFRKYPSFYESFQDNAKVLKTTTFGGGVYYYSGTWKSNTNSYKDATAWLTGRYATAPNYNLSLNNVIQLYNLTQYDTPSTGGGSSSTGGGSSTGSSTASTYTVKAGDSVWSIANRFGISMDQLKEWNNIPASNMIHPNQVLVVKKATAGGSTGTSTPSASDGNYLVQQGESLGIIAKKFGVTVAQLKAWNNLTSDLILPFQELIVKQPSTSTGNGNSNSGNTNTGNANSGSGSTTTPTNPTTPSTTDTIYTVKAGDSVWGISNKYGISMAQLKTWNNIPASNMIHPNQKLIVKKGSSTSTGNTNTGNTNSGSGATTTPTNPTTPSTTDTIYTVKAGDSVWGISNKYGISMAQLKTWNNIPASNMIHPNQKLIVKKGSAASSTTTATKPAATTTATHKVVKGDTLWGISHKYGMTIDQLKALNGLTSNMIYLNQTLKVK